MTGTLLAPLPTPVKARHPSAAVKVSASPVSSIPAAATASPTLITIRGPQWDASAPPITVSARYPVRFAVARMPAWVLSSCRAACIGGSSIV